MRWSVLVRRSGSCGAIDSRAGSLVGARRRCPVFETDEWEDWQHAVDGCSVAARGVDRSWRRPASAATVTIVCGVVPQSVELCRDGSEAWAKARGHEVRVLAYPDSSTRARELVGDLLAVQADDLDVLELDIVWPGVLAPHLLDLESGEDSGRRRAFSGRARELHRRRASACSRRGISVSAGCSTGPICSNSTAWRCRRAGRSSRPPHARSRKASAAQAMPGSWGFSGRAGLARD